MTTSRDAQLATAAKLAITIRYADRHIVTISRFLDRRHRDPSCR